MSAARGKPELGRESLGIEIVRAGAVYFPWNYRRRVNGRRIGRRVHAAERGTHVFNALDAAGRIVGSAVIQIGARASERMILTEEFAFGGGNNSRGPYLWPDDDDIYIIALLGLWTRPEFRRRGASRRLVQHVAEFGLPVYVAFGNPHMDRWFNAELLPSEDLVGEWQDAVRAFAAYQRAPWKEDAAGGSYQWELSCTAAKRVAGGMLYDETPTLFELLFTPPRATWYELDGGAGEAELSDTPFAADRRFGYDLTITACEDAGLDIDLDIDLDEDADDVYEAAANEAVTVRATGYLHVTSATLLNDYASFRRMLRTGVAHPPPPASEAEAVHELLVASHDPLYRDVLNIDVSVRSAG